MPDQFYENIMTTECGHKSYLSCYHGIFNSLTTRSSPAHSCYQVKVCHYNLCPVLNSTQQNHQKDARFPFLFLNTTLTDEAPPHLLYLLPVTLTHHKVNALTILLRTTNAWQEHLVCWTSLTSHRKEGHSFLHPATNNRDPKSGLLESAFFGAGSVTF